MTLVDDRKGVLSCERGFTLLEMLIAISIFSVGLLAVAEMQIRAINTNAFGNTMTVATNLAQEKLDELKSAAFTSPTLAIGDYSDTNNPIDETGAAGGSYIRRWEVDARTATTRTITVTVARRFGSSVSLQSITRGGGE